MSFQTPIWNPGRFHLMPSPMVIQTRYPLGSRIHRKESRARSPENMLRYISANAKTLGIGQVVNTQSACQPQRSTLILGPSP